MAGIPRDRIIRHELRHVYRIDHAIIPGLRIPLAYADQESRALYNRIALPLECDSSQKRLYISRRALNAERSVPRGRVLLNEGDLIEQLRKMDFEIVEPQALDAASQIRLFRNAELVVGPSGSGMFNAVFCRPDTKLIDIESEPHWIIPHSGLFSSAGLRYGIFEGLAVDKDWSRHHKPWRVNVQRLAERIEQSW
jgi:capsular polysaccharide biosynthesis protein